MSFLLLQIISLVGVIAVVLLTVYVGWSRPAEIAGLAEAEARFRQDFPSQEIAGGVVDKSRRHALLRLAQDAAQKDPQEGSFGLVSVLGDRLVTRRLPRTAIRSVERSGEGLLLRMDDLTFPRVEIDLQPGDVDKWGKYLRIGP